VIRRFELQAEIRGQEKQSRNQAGVEQPVSHDRRGQIACAQTQEREYQPAGEQSRGPAWSPDATQIAIVTFNTLWVMNVDGSNPHSLGTVGTGQRPAWQPVP
jgi:Tol biopolymer transport system component